MDAKLSNGYGSEYVVLNAKTQKPATGVIVLSPISDRLAFDVLRIYLDRHLELLPELETAWAQWEQGWKITDEIAKSGEVL